jgi:hypothetical protein
MSKRRNGECSIFPYRSGYAAYAWVTTPDGERKRKWVYGKTHNEVHAKWIKLQSQASEGPVPTSVPPVSQYMNYWIREVVKPNLAPKTHEKYETFTRLHILPYLGTKRLDKLQVKRHPVLAEQARPGLPVLRSGQGRRPAGGQAPLLRDRPVLSRRFVCTEPRRCPRHASGCSHLRNRGRDHHS